MLCCGLLALVVGTAALFRRQLAALLLAASAAVPVIAFAFDGGQPVHAASFCGESPA